MVQLDGSLFMNQQAPDFSKIGEGFERGLRIGDLMRQKKENDLAKEKQNTIAEGFNVATVVNPDGSRTFDTMKFEEFMGSKGLNQDSYRIKNEMRAQDAVNAKNNLSKLHDQLSTEYSLLSKVKDQNSLMQQKAIAKSMGLDVSQVPDVYDKAYFDNMAGHYLSAKEKLDIQLKREEAQEKNKIEWAKLSKKDQSGDGLPLDKKKIVETLSTKIANVSSIKNELDTFVSMWPTLTENERLKQGELLLKTLNSPQGADAIGVEEANRLGNKLRFAFGNLTNDNPTQFGRDLEGFYDDVKNTSVRLGGTIQKNQDQVDESMGRPGVVKIKKEDMPPDLDLKIQGFMQKNNIKDKNEAIRILKDNGRL